MDMHPSDRIRGEKSEILKGKKIALCVTGSISSVEAVKVARELIRHGAQVYPYATDSALKFIGKDSLLFATGNPVVDELTGKDEHLESFDLILVAPATANIISKAACGIADDAVSTLILANLQKCMFVPTMHEKMMNNPIFQENINKLKKYCKFIEPIREEDKLKLPDRENIAAEVMHSLRNELKGKKILVIGGAGYEKIDNFRIITNLATGRMGVELAKYAYYYGGEVKLLISLHSVKIPSFLPFESFGSIGDLLSRMEEYKNYDVIIVPAALPDFKPVKVDGKIKSLREFKEVKYTENPKFLKELRKTYNGFLVGFKAESGVSEEELIRRARERMKEYSLDIVVANLLEDVKPESTRAFIIFDDDFERVEGSKDKVAKRIIEIVVESL